MVQEMEENKIKILVAEDDSKSAQLIGALLKKEGYSISMTSRGLECLRIAKAHLPDIILLDIYLTDSNGIEICQKIKSDKEISHIPVIFITSEKATSYKIKGFEVGGADYVNKPFDQIELLARIRAHVSIKILREKLVKNAEVQTQMKAHGVISDSIYNPLTCVLSNLEFIEESLDNGSFDKNKLKRLIKEARKAGEEIVLKVDQLKSLKEIPFEEFDGSKSILFDDDE